LPFETSDADYDSGCHPNSQISLKTGKPPRGWGGWLSPSIVTRVFAVPSGTAALGRDSTPARAHAGVCQRPWLLSCCPACESAFSDSWIFMSFIFTPQLCNFGVYPPLSIVFPFVGVFLCMRGKAYSEE